MRRNRVTAPTDLMSELDSDDDDKKLSTQSTVVSSSTAPTQGLSTQKTFVSPAASANKPPNPALKIRGPTDGTTSSTGGARSARSLKSNVKPWLVISFAV